MKITESQLRKIIHEELNEMYGRNIYKKRRDPYEYEDKFEERHPFDRANEVLPKVGDIINNRRVLQVVIDSEYEPALIEMSGVDGGYSRWFTSSEISKMKLPTNY